MKSDRHNCFELLLFPLLAVLLFACSDGGSSNPSNSSSESTMEFELDSEAELETEVDTDTDTDTEVIEELSPDRNSEDRTGELEVECSAGFGDASRYETRGEL